MATQRENSINSMTSAAARATKAFSERVDVGAWAERKVSSISSEVPLMAMVKVPSTETPGMLTLTVPPMRPAMPSGRTTSTPSPAHPHRR